ncbi:cysteine hydrolase family protein [Streptomyces sp. KL116D]|uniref:cysteine hydrolase family protein n=1 Tax=Streptomyces sp. KL116D TaxID=3045152 RepID=UPI0035584307
MRPALLVMDVQRDIVDAVDDGGSGYLPRLRRAIDAARSAEDPPSSRRHRLSPAIQRSARATSHSPPSRGAGLYVEGETGTAIHPEVAPEPGDVVVTKRRASAFRQ